MIFVFGSNLLGIHGAGAARHAAAVYGVQTGVGEGPTGYAYALPTCAEPGLRLDLKAIDLYVDRFLRYAADHPKDQFQVTAIGTGIAGYKAEDIAPMFQHAPDNVWLPASFYKAMYRIGYRQCRDDHL